MRLLLFVFCCLYGSLSAQLTITVTSVPSNTPASDDIYIAGSLNNWDPGNAAYKLTQQPNGDYKITVSPQAGTIEFKFTRGSWATVEGNANGGFLPNRTYSYSGGTASVNLTILSWEDLGGGNSTAAENVEILSNSFFMPQLGVNRRVWIYLPPDYETTNKFYPVLYMQDGQNVFDAATSFSGEWEVDESLNELHAAGDYGCIVVAVDNGGAARIDEYSPWVNNNYGEGGKGEAYMDFMVETLKPHIDANFRTLPGRDYTGIMGSSLGSLISHYGIIEHQDVFSKAGLFSSAYWFSGDSCQLHTELVGKEAAAKFYMLVGGNEEASDDIVYQTENMRDVLIGEGWSANTQVKYVYKANGTHSESFWRSEFAAAYEWLFGDLVLSDNTANAPVRIQCFPNPTDTFIQWEILLPSANAQLFDVNGKLVREEPLHNNRMDVSSLPAGIYLLRDHPRR